MSNQLAQDILTDDRWRLPPVLIESADVLLPKSQQIDWGVRLQGIANAWKTTKGKGIRVGICDTGSPAHPDVSPGVVAAKDFTGSRTGYVDSNIHGTHVAGIIGARDNETGVVGVAPECELACAKVLGDDGSGSSSGVAAGIDWCVAQKCHIINMSLGSSQPDQQIRAAIVRARAVGVWVICAAGNEGPGPNTVGYPGAWEECIAVASINQLMAVSRFSSRGPQVDVAAPGEKILSTTLSGTYGILSGTSMASPFVAGAVALILAAHKDGESGIPVTVDQMIEHLTRGAKDIGTPGKDPESGFGIIDASKWFTDMVTPPPTNGGDMNLWEQFKTWWPLIKQVGPLIPGLKAFWPFLEKIGDAIFANRMDEARTHMEALKAKVKTVKLSAQAQKAYAEIKSMAKDEPTAEAFDFGLIMEFIKLLLGLLGRK